MEELEPETAKNRIVPEMVRQVLPVPLTGMGVRAQERLPGVKVDPWDNLGIRLLRGWEGNQREKIPGIVGV